MVRNARLAVGPGIIIGINEHKQAVERQTKPNSEMPIGKTYTRPIDNI